MTCGACGFENPQACSARVRGTARESVHLAAAALHAALQGRNGPRNPAPPASS